MTNSASSQVTADFTTINPTTACGSIVVEFQDLSTGNPNSWLWDLGNGNISTLKNPVAVYNLPGVYNVRLTVSDGATNDTKTEFSFVTVFENPTAIIDIATPNFGCTPHNIDFIDFSNSSVPITSWFWDFGDGGNSNMQNPTYDYSLEGSFTVSLLVTDANSCQDLMIIPSYIETFSRPEAQFVADILSSCSTNEMVSFDDLSFGNGLTYFWDFGDGTTSVLQNPTHNYSTGIYTVSLIVNNGLCTDTLRMSNYIEIGAVSTTDFAISNNSGCADLSVQFTDLSTAGVDTWFWDFGDGTTSTLQNPTHNYTNAGSYDVMLKTSIGTTCISDKIVFGAIEVFDKPNISFNSNATFSCDAPFVVDFSDNTLGAISWNWDFGNGNTSNLQNPTEVFTSMGNYTISLIVTDFNMCSNTLVSTNYIVVDKPIADFSAVTLGGCNPFNATFSDLSASNQTIMDWSWNFGDGNTSNSQSPNHLYNTSGFYDVSLYITDDNGCISNKTINSYIQVADPPQADFVAAPLITCAGTSVNFSDLSTTTTIIDSWFWDFGDGTTSANQNPSHSYSIVGNYGITLITSTLGCSDTFVISNYIEVIEPTAFFTPIFNCPNPLSVDFTDMSIGADNVFWDFGDATTSTQLNPTHIFSSRGTYNVTLTASNIATSCAHSYVFPLQVTEPIANFTYLVNGANTLEDSVGCKPHRVYLDNLSQDWAWYTVLWEDGYVGNSRVDHEFDSVGTFDVEMIITDIHSCKDTFVYQDMYSIKGVDADFEIANSLGCDSMLVEFNDLTNPTSTIEWQFGDGGTSTLTQPQYIYYTPGFYDVTLYAESSYGCKDTMKKIEYIQFEYPVSDFSVSQATSCFNEQINFTNQSSGLGLSYTWDFGDGTTSNSLNTTHTYNQNGVFDITLSVVDSFGCAKTLIKNSHIAVQEPIADFSSNTVSSNCPPLISGFNNLSSADAIIWAWDFGDGTTSNLNTPSHLYANSGVFDVKLMVENSFGCKDTFVQNGLINISGPLGNYSIIDNDICFYDTAIFTPNAVVNTTNYFWDFGDGTFSVDSQATHLYLNAGIYFPSLILENSSGCQFTVQSSDSIVINTININAGNTVSICKNDSIALLAIADSGSVQWSPSIFLSNVNVLNPMATPNTTTVFTATISDGKCQNTDTVRVVVNQEIPIPSINVSNQCEEDTLVFAANSGLTTNNISWFWDLGNGNMSTQQNTTNNYPSAGNYLISLLVTNLDNACATKTFKTVDVYASPNADFTADEVCLGELTNFNDISTSVDGNLMQWVWDFGYVGGLSAQKNPLYKYTIEGTFAVTLNVISDYGCEHQITKNIVVNELPIADFTTTEACLNDFNLFQSTSIINLGNITNWYWTFGDGTTFVGDNETDHIYASDGTFDVNLIVTSDKGCEGEIMHQAVVHPLPNPSFTSNYFCIGDNTSFYDNSNISSGNIISWNWNFGDGIGIANYINPNYQYANEGTYSVSLTLMSDKLCENIITNNITISPLPVVNIYANEKACVGEEIKVVDLTLVDGGYITSWNWNLGDGTTSDKQEVTHTYNSAGTYSLSLDVTSNLGCSTSKTYPNMISVFNKPTADFMTSTQITSIINPEVTLTDKSFDANTWLWDFGNGEMSVEKNPTIIYSDTGVYIVSLMVTNSDGCSDKFSKEINVRPEFTLFIPNAFTPNGDGLDDDFMAYGQGMIRYQMIVYNRWGEQVFQSDNKEIGWNGKDRFDNYLPNGIYLYHIAVTDFNSKPWVYNGEINLMK